MTDELIEKLASVTTLEEAKALIKDNSDSLTDEEKAAFESSINKLNEEGNADSKAKMGELSDDELDNIVGGGFFSWSLDRKERCPKCRKRGYIEKNFMIITDFMRCSNCGYKGRSLNLTIGAGYIEI